MKKSIQTMILIILITHLSACASSKKTQSEHYREMQQGTIYKTYQKVSIKAMMPVVKEYDKKLAEENKAQIGETHVHALLGLIWIASAQPRFALAESDYALSQARDPRDRYAALALQSLAMHEQGWYHLASLKSTEASALIQTQGFSNRYKNVLVLVHVSGAALAVLDNNIPHTISAVREAGVILNEDWLVQMGDATEDAYNGTQAKAIEKLEKLNNDANLTDKERQGANKVLEIAKQGGNDVTNKMAKAVVDLAVDEAINKNRLTASVLKEVPEKYRDKLARYL